MMDRNTSPRAYKCRLTRYATTLALCALTITSIVPATALAAPTGTNQNVPGLADTPGNKSSVTPPEQALSEGSLKLQDGLALLNSAVLLKVYYYAYSGKPIDYSQILTANMENIIPPNLVQPSNEQKKEIDRLIQIAKAHPDILIKVDDIALEPYDKASLSFPVVNRVFMNGARFYFDNSRYHYDYSGANAFRALRCTDGKIVGAINSAIANYQHFSMDIVGHVSHAVTKEAAFVIDLSKVTLKDASGDPLLTQVKP